MPTELSERFVNISKERKILVTPLLTVDNVMRLLVCSRSSAYEHMNRALCRTERPGNLLRVPLDVFEAYVATELGLAAPRTREPAPIGARGTARLSGSPATVGTVSRSSSSGAPAIRVAKPPRARR